MVVVMLDKQDDIGKEQDLLTGKNTQRLITEDPTTKHKNKLFQILRNYQGTRWTATYKRLYPTSAASQILRTP